MLWSEWWTERARQQGFLWKTARDFTVSEHEVGANFEGVAAVLTLDDLEPKVNRPSVEAEAAYHHQREHAALAA